ncbi:hypothetical protein GUITHDRAFT_108359 [Guillardia theta CCMP2712]|uniref:Tubulin--tyrosine ligase n=2 Tax=Guillardia theta TaxID=55529 RepID=L1JBJ8_GUITC|nr:hypothetical protein GUITHDRAFT_108359 [Guillardia theta CCMP2712]EKX45908.1 hypothetical protein GUITHDRAFT_108359 [Guillardia theta CCMP2712]|mmetsp:Transcript_5054/g.18183  ORF Transcript_5054/g.18183 Transcript_5054/m.18183 type:complete len:407 (+) Transcript_5054:284-1504(+)|eukprot:XP_005832888.1 hypothetical protein GUITHDRAFT_108359 [Guillardia theta CCMP2712]
MSASRSDRGNAYDQQRVLNFVSLDSGSSIYQAVASELWARREWKELAPPKDGLGTNLSMIKHCNVILGPCQGKGIPWDLVCFEQGEQVVNYLLGSKFITQKADLALLLRKYFAANSHVEPFMPLTYVVVPQRGAPKVSSVRGRTPVRGYDDQRSAFLKEMMAREEGDYENVWVAKTSKGSKGSGVKVLQGSTALDWVDDTYGRTGEPIAVQKYVENPLLIYGFKFDVRVWALLDVELGLYVHREGVLRLSAHPYVADDLEDTFAHLTNHCIAAQSEYYESLFEENEMFFDDFRDFLRKHHQDVDLDRDILPQVNRQILHTVRAVWPRLRFSNRPGGFQLYGFDFIVDSDFSVWLLEVNGAPAAADRLKVKIAQDLIDLCIDSRFSPESEEYNDFRLIAPIEALGEE